MSTETLSVISRSLDVIRSMAGINQKNVAELATIMGTSTRNVYYLINELKNYGFVVHHSHGFYSLDAHSPFFQEISQSVNFTNDQANFLFGLLDGVEENTPYVVALKQKLHDFYRLGTPVKVKFSRKDYRNLSMLKYAVSKRRLAVLHDYSSSNSQTTSTRIVEPYIFLGNETDVRAYEPKSGKNKTFKIARIGKVEVLSDSWQYLSEHRDVFTDIFMFSGEERHHVLLRFDLMAYNLIQEEVPSSVGCLHAEDEKHWIFEADLVNYKGIGRFSLGLFDHIEILSDDGLKAYIKDSVQAMSQTVAEW